MSVFELVSRCIDEIALEGEQGCTLSELWRLLRTSWNARQQKEVVIRPEFTESEKKLIWHGICTQALRMRELHFNWTENDHAAEIPWDKLASVEVLEAENHQLRITASEALRMKSLGIYDNSFLSSDMLMYLAAVGKMRYQGLQATHTKKILPSSFSGDIHYFNEVLMSYGLIHRLLLSGSKKCYYLSRFSQVYRYEEVENIQKVEDFLSQHGHHVRGGNFELPMKFSLFTKDAGEFTGIRKKKEFKRFLEQEWGMGRSWLEVDRTVSGNHVSILSRTYDNLATTGMDSEPAPRDPQAGLMKELTTSEHIEWFMSQNNWGATAAELTAKLQIRYKKISRLLDLLANDTGSFQKHAVSQGRNKATVVVMKPERRQLSKFGQNSALSRQSQEDTSSQEAATRLPSLGEVPGQLPAGAPDIQVAENTNPSSVLQMISKRELQREAQIVESVKKQGTILARKLVTLIVEREAKEGYQSQMDRKTLKKLVSKIEEASEGIQRCMLNYDGQQTLCVVDKSLSEQERCEKFVPCFFDIPKARSTFGTSVSGIAAFNREFNRPGNFMERLRNLHQALLCTYANKETPEVVKLPTTKLGAVLQLKLETYLSVFSTSTLTGDQASVQELRKCCTENLTVAETCERHGLSLKMTIRTYWGALERMGILSLQAERRGEALDAVNGQMVPLYVAVPYLRQSVSVQRWYRTGSNSVLVGADSVPSSTTSTNAIPLGMKIGDSIPLGTVEQVHEAYAQLKTRATEVAQVSGSILLLAQAAEERPATKKEQSAESPTVPPVENTVKRLPWLRLELWMDRAVTSVTPSKRARPTRSSRRFTGSKKRSRSTKRRRTSSVASESMKPEVESEVDSDESSDNQQKPPVAGDDLVKLKQAAFEAYMKAGSTHQSVVAESATAVPHAPISQVISVASGLLEPAQSQTKVARADGALVLPPYDVPFGEQVRYMLTERRILQVMLLVHCSASVTIDMVEKAFSCCSRSQVVSSLHDLETLDYVRKVTNPQEQRAANHYEQIIRKQIVLSEKFLQPLMLCVHESSMTLVPGTPDGEPLHAKPFQCCQRVATGSEPHDEPLLISTDNICNRCVLQLGAMTVRDRLKLGAYIPGLPGEPRSGHPTNGTAPIVPLQQLSKFEPLFFARISQKKSESATRVPPTSKKAIMVSETFPYVVPRSFRDTNVSPELVEEVNRSLVGAGELGLSVVEVAVILQRMKKKGLAVLSTSNMHEEVRALKLVTAKLEEALNLAMDVTQHLLRQETAVIVPLFDAQTRIVSTSDHSFLSPWKSIGRRSNSAVLLLWSNLDGSVNEKLLSWMRSSVLYSLVRSGGGLSIWDLYSKLEPAMGLWDVQVLVRGMVEENLLVCSSDSQFKRSPWHNEVDVSEHSSPLHIRRTVLRLGSGFYDLLGATIDAE